MLTKAILRGLLAATIAVSTMTAQAVNIELAARGEIHFNTVLRQEENEAWHRADQLDFLSESLGPPQGDELLKDSSAKKTQEIP